MLMPDAAANMGDGWETKRRRGPGHDWAIVRLGIPGAIRASRSTRRTSRATIPIGVGRGGVVTRRHGVSAEWHARDRRLEDGRCRRRSCSRITCTCSPPSSRATPRDARAAQHLSRRRRQPLPRLRHSRSPGARRRAVLRQLNAMDDPELRARSPISTPRRGGSSAWRRRGRSPRRRAAGGGGAAAKRDATAGSRRSAIIRASASGRGAAAVGRGRARRRASRSAAAAASPRTRRRWRRQTAPTSAASATCSSSRAAGKNGAGDPLALRERLKNDPAKPSCASPPASRRRSPACGWSGCSDDAFPLTCSTRQSAARRRRSPCSCSVEADALDRHLARGRNGDGRVPALLPAGAASPGEYRLTFDVGAYFARAASSRSTVVSPSISSSATPRRTITCRCCSVRTATRPTAGAKRRREAFARLTLPECDCNAELQAPSGPTCWCAGPTCSPRSCGSDRPTTSRGSTGRCAARSAPGNGGGVDGPQRRVLHGGQAEDARRAAGRGALVPLGSAATLLSGFVLLNLSTTTAG